MDLLELGQRVDAAYPANPGEAIPYMQEIRGRLTNAMSEEFRKIYRENLYRLGLAHMLWFQATGESGHLAAGIPYWDEFIEEFISDQRHPLAMLNRADSYYGVERWSEAVRAYLHFLQLYTRQLDSEELLGLLQRLVAAADAADNTAEIKAALEPFLSPQYGSEIRLFVLNVLFDQALVSNDLGELMALVGEINQYRAFRYDLGLNLRLLNVGDRFEEDERFLEASLLFSMVLPVEELLKAIEDSLIDLEERLFRRQFIASEESELRRQRDDLREQRAEIASAPRYTANLRWRQARVLQLMGRSYEAYFGFLRLIREYPQHTHIEQFRYAAFLQALECGYSGEAIAQGETYLETPAFVLFEKPIAARLARLYEASGDVEKLALLADNFLHRFPYEPVAAQMAHSLGNAFFRAGATERILETFPYWAESYPDGVFIDSVHYWSGMAYLFTGDFEPALAAFEDLIETSPGSVYYREAAFRRGVAFFGMGEYASARAIFTQWVEDSPGHPLQPEAHVFLGDLDAMEAEVERALAHYAQVEALGGSQALIDHAYFESASLLLANKRYAEHAEILQRYLDTYPEAPAGAEAVLRLAEAELEQGDIAGAFQRYRDGIERFGNRVRSDHVDQLVDAWWTTDTRIRARYADTNAFIERLLSDAAFRRQMLYDRVAQINYFQEHALIPAELQEMLTLRHPFYEQLAKETPREEGTGGAVLDVDAFGELLAWQERLRTQQGQLPVDPPAVVFAAMREEALAQGQDALALRLLRILNVRAGYAVSPAELGAAEVALASPATQVWIARIEGQADSVEAQMLLRDLIRQYPDSDAIADALHLLAHFEMENGFFDEAAQLYERILQEYFSSPLASDAAIQRGEALRLARRYEDAVQAYTMILNQRTWRGELWAEATFKIGLCFLGMKEEGKAQGFFERTYLAYSGYPEWAGKAVMESADLLLSRGDRQSALETYQFFINSANAAESPLYPVILQRMELL
jgi:TolA-binding protein